MYRTNVYFQKTQYRTRLVYKMFTATGLLYKEILIHHTTPTQVKSRWVTIHLQVLVAAVDSTACPPSSVFEVSGCTQCFWVSPPQKLGCDVNKSRQSFHFCSSGKKKRKCFIRSFVTHYYGALPNCTRQQVGKNHPVKKPRPHSTLAKTQNATGAKTLLRRCCLSHSCRWRREF